MLKNVIIAGLLANLGFTYWIIARNIRAYKRLESAAAHVILKLEKFDSSKISNEVVAEVRKHLYHIAFTGLKIK